MVKNLPASLGDTRDTGLIPWSGRAPGGGHGNPLPENKASSSTAQGGHSPQPRPQRPGSLLMVSARAGKGQLCPFDALI